MYFTLENMITYWKYMWYFLDIPKDVVLDTSIAIRPFTWFSVIVRENTMLFCGHCFKIWKLNIHTQAHPYTLFQPLLSYILTFVMYSCFTSYHILGGSVVEVSVLSHILWEFIVVQCMFRSCDKRVIKVFFYTPF